MKVTIGGVIHFNKKCICVLFFLIFILFMYLHNGVYVPDKLQSEKVNLYKLLNVAIKAAENGGKEVVRTKDHIKIKTKGLTKEGQLDSVTTADYLSHCSMLKTLKYFFPSINIVSEESETKCEVNAVIDYSIRDLVVENLTDEYVQQEDVTVWIDPLDATQEYTEKLYKYVTTMVCVAVKGKAVLGVIHKPFNASTAWAWVNKAVSKNIAIDDQKNSKSEKDIKIVVSRSHSGQIEQVLQKNFKKQFEMISAAGAGYKALEVASRRADAYLHITAIKKWDICAGNAILNALGGTMTTKYNKNINYSPNDDVVNANGIIATMENHDLFLGIL